GFKIRKKSSAQVESPAPVSGEEPAPERAEALVVHPAAFDAEPSEDVAPRRRVVDVTKAQPARRREREEASAAAASAVPGADSVTTDDFAAMFEGGGGRYVERRRFEMGDKVMGVIAYIDSNFIFVDLGGRGEARAPRAQYTDADGALEVAEGEEVEFTVLGFSAEGIMLGKHLDARDAGMDMIEQAYEARLPVQGKVVSKNRGGFVVDVFNQEAFCPISQIDTRRVEAEEFELYLNRTFAFRITEIRDGGRSIVVSRAALLREEEEARRAELMQRIAPGEIVSAVVRSIQDFGAFADLGGVDGLVHISELSWGNVDHPTDIVREGQAVEVKILEIESRGEGKSPRIALSMKQAQSDPWDTVHEELHVGKQVDGVVVRVAPFGAFVELYQGVDGLVHVSELSWEHVSRPSDVVSVGDRVRVEILEINLAKRRIGLSMKSVGGDPWSSIHERFAVGMEVEGEVKNIEDFGVFVDLGGGITALLPRSEMNLSRGEEPYSKARSGKRMTARVLDIKAGARKMALTLREDVREDEGGAHRESRGDSRRDQRGSGGSPRSWTDNTGSGGGLGTLGDLLNLVNLNDD
ncbi:MAG: S1 RNA-binding domain-containing protein, partial [Myxococcota bacterium]